MTSRSRPAEAGRRDEHADHLNVTELRQGAGGEPSLLSSTTRAPCSTSSATACTASCRTSPIRRCPVRAVLARLRRAADRSSTSTGWNGRRCSALRAATTRPVSRCRTTCSALQAARKFQPGLRDGGIPSPRALIDLELHTASAPSRLDVDSFEKRHADRSACPPRSSAPSPAAFPAHLLRRAYAAGYYSYLWSEVMDADAFGAFEEAGDPFDPGHGQAAVHVHLFRRLARSRGAYIAFRGREPEVAALLRRRGLLETPEAAWSKPSSSTVVPAGATAPGHHTRGVKEGLCHIARQ